MDVHGQNNQKDAELIDYIRERVVRLEDVTSFDSLIDEIGDARYVLLGEASHGTSEFYQYRAALSKRLIQEKGFSFIAVEGDWPSCYQLNRFIKHYNDAPASAEHALHEFQRWPTWMWANDEIKEFAEWQRLHNVGREDRQKIGFYGIDMYSLWESMDEIIKYLERTSAPELNDVRKAFSCFEPYNRDSQTYGLSETYLSEHCENEVVETLMRLRERRAKAHPEDESALALELNAMVTVDAERYYRAMFHMGPDSWNIRDVHMVNALEKLMEFYGPSAKCIVWEHNTHIGDARYTDMADQGMVNVGQLLRERHQPEEVFAVGFGTHHGTALLGRPGEHRWKSWTSLMHGREAGKT